MDRNRLKPLREYFDNAPTRLRFLYYVIAAIENYRYVEEARRVNDVFLDRTIFSTLVYHKAYGLSKAWTSFIPKFLYNQFNGLVFLHAGEDERRKRLENRSVANNLLPQKSDDKSIALASRIYEEYQKVLPRGTIFVITDFKTPREVVDEVRRQIPLEDSTV